jgi:hypothetical protein
MASTERPGRPVKPAKATSGAPSDLSATRRGGAPSKFEALGAAAARAASQFARGFRSSSGPDAIERERQRQAAAHASALSKHRSALYGLRARFIVGGTAMLGGSALGAGALAGEQIAGAVLAGGVAAYGGYQSVKAKRSIDGLHEPPAPPPIMPAPVPLPAGTPGAAAADRITGARMQIMELIPTVEYLQPEAAAQVFTADATAAPATAAVVERIRLMSKIIREMPGSPAAQAAALSLPVLEQRLTEGSSAYYELLDAVIGLASAPDLNGSVGTALRPAINELQAYTAGLQRAADTWG